MLGFGSELMLGFLTGQVFYNCSGKQLTGALVIITFAVIFLFLLYKIFN